MSDKYNQKWTLYFAQGEATTNAITLSKDTTYYSESECVVNSDRAWQRHENKHKEQWRRDGILFPFIYIYRHLKYGYENNPYEVDARNAEICGVRG